MIPKADQPRKYRKKPVEIEALRTYVGMRFERLRAFCSTAIYGGAGWHIPTLEGTMTVRPGDYVIKGISGEFCLCKPDIFHQTYDAVED